MSGVEECIVCTRESCRKRSILGKNYIAVKAWWVFLVTQRWRIFWVRDERHVKEVCKAEWDFHKAQLERVRTCGTMAIREDLMKVREWAPQEVKCGPILGPTPAFEAESPESRVQLFLLIKGGRSGGGI